MADQQPDPAIVRLRAAQARLDAADDAASAAYQRLLRAQDGSAEEHAAAYCERCSAVEELRRARNAHTEAATSGARALLAALDAVTAERDALRRVVRMLTADEGEYATRRDLAPDWRVRTTERCGRGDTLPAALRAAGCDELAAAVERAESEVGRG